MAEISFEVFKSGHEALYCTKCYAIIFPKGQSAHVRWHDYIERSRGSE
jgi:hypothetical protein